MSKDIITIIDPKTKSVFFPIFKTLSIEYFFFAKKYIIDSPLLNPIKDVKKSRLAINKTYCPYSNVKLKQLKINIKKKE